ncbi:MAG: hypothetical protein DDT30_01240 [Dehalococcoidia bacterium]|nr:hypothetical protein [Bacillota bacterium]MBT9143254.1 hypothetical protein [Bacillota bacterium]
MFFQVLRDQSQQRFLDLDRLFSLAEEKVFAGQKSRVAAVNLVGVGYDLGLGGLPKYFDQVDVGHAKADQVFQHVAGTDRRGAGRCRLLSAAGHPAQGRQTASRQAEGQPRFEHA